MKSLFEHISPLFEEDNEYQKFFRSKLEQYKVKSPSELSDEDKKKFFAEIKSEWKGSNESLHEAKVLDKSELKPFGVFRSGGSINNREFPAEWYNEKGDIMSSSFDSEIEATDTAKRLNKGLSPGEKKYYRIKYYVASTDNVHQGSMKESLREWKIGDKIELIDDGTIAQISKPGIRGSGEHLKPEEFYITIVKPGSKYTRMGFDTTADWLDKNAKLIESLQESDDSKFKDPSYSPKSLEDNADYVEWLDMNVDSDSSKEFSKILDKFCERYDKSGDLTIKDCVMKAGLSAAQKLVSDLTVYNSFTESLRESHDAIMKAYDKLEAANDAQTLDKIDAIFTQANAMNLTIEKAIEKLSDTQLADMVSLLKSKGLMESKENLFDFAKSQIADVKSFKEYDKFMRMGLQKGFKKENLTDLVKDLKNYTNDDVLDWTKNIYPGLKESRMNEVINDFTDLKIGDIVGNTVQGFEYEVIGLKNELYGLKVKNIKTGKIFDTTYQNMTKRVKNTNPGLKESNVNEAIKSINDFSNFGMDILHLIYDQGIEPKSIVDDLERIIEGIKYKVVTKSELRNHFENQR